MFYLTTNRQNILQFLDHVAAGQQILTVIEGQPGVGKTSLIQQFASQVHEDIYLYTLTADPGLTTSQLIDYITGEAALENDASSHDLPRLKNLLQQSYANNMILIDAAEKLPLATRQDLLYLLADQDFAIPQLFIVLLGQTGLAADIDQQMAVLNMEFQAKHFDLQAFNLAETTNYLKDYLAQTHAKTDVLTEQQIKTIYRQSQGLPGRINQIAKQYLSNATLPDGSEKNRQRVVSQASFWRRHRIRIISLLAIALILLILLLQRLLPQHVQTPLHLTEKLLLPNPILIVHHPLADGAIEIHDAPVAPTTSHAASSTSPESTLSAPAADIQKPAVVAAQAPAEAEAKTYVWQLIGLDDLSQAQHFVAANNLLGRSQILQTSYQNKPWYIVIYGHYATPQAAEAAYQAMPAEIKAMRPWLRLMPD